MKYKFVFRSTETGEIAQSVAQSLWSAANNLKITTAPPRTEHYVSSPHSRPAWMLMPWMLWECWEGEECIWHYTADGEIRTGKR